MKDSKYAGIISMVACRKKPLAGAKWMWETREKKTSWKVLESLREDPHNIREGYTPWGAL